VKPISSETRNDQVAPKRRRYAAALLHRRKDGVHDLRGQQTELTSAIMEISTVEQSAKTYRFRHPSRFFQTHFIWNIA
jgi:hypothetical protein